MLRDFAARAFPELSLPEDEGARWREIYRGEPDWRFVKKSGLYAKGERRMSLLNAAVSIAEEFTALVFAEGAEIRCDRADFEKYLLDILGENDFLGRAASAIASGFGTGVGVFKLYCENSRPRLDCPDGECFIPAAYDDNGVSEGIFVRESFKNGRYYRLFERHFLSDGNAAVEMRLFRSESRYDLGIRVPLSEIYPELPEAVVYEGIKSPMFRLFTPKGGRAVYAGAEDTLKALDIAFDSLSREFVLGKKRIIVPSACIRTVVDPESGSMRKYFDADDEAFVALKAEENEELKITDNTVALRVDEHIKAINSLLGILCFQCGLSPSAVSFTSRGLKTAAEVISEDSRTARTVRLYKNALSSLLCDICRQLILLAQATGELPQGEFTVGVTLRDGIVTDDGSNEERALRLYSGGVIERGEVDGKIRSEQPSAVLKGGERIGE